MFPRAYVLILVYICLVTNVYQSVFNTFQSIKFLLQSLDNYESAIGDPNVKSAPRIEAFPPAFQAIPRNPIVLDLAFNFIEFPSLQNRMKKDRKGFISRLWGWVPSARIKDFSFHGVLSLSLFAARVFVLAGGYKNIETFGTDLLTTSQYPCEFWITIRI